MAHHLHLTPDIVDKLPVPKIEQAIAAVKHIIEEIEKNK